MTRGALSPTIVSLPRRDIAEHYSLLFDDTDQPHPVVATLER